MKPARLDHIVFIVRDLDAATDAWEHIFGLSVRERIQSELLQASLALLPVAGAPDGFIELCSPTTGGPLTDWLDERGEGMLSVSIEVEGIDAAVAELQEKDVDVSDVVSGPLAGTRVARFSPDATHGVRLQLIERG